MGAEGPEIAHLASLGLVETYRRTHAGQGTENVCYCFDNLFLELLWVNDRAAMPSSVAACTNALYGGPMGHVPLAWHGERSQAGPASTLTNWAFTPPYLPGGMSISVATDSDDLQQQMMFESPGSTFPLDCRAGSRHRDQAGDACRCTA